MVVSAMGRELRDWNAAEIEELYAAEPGPDIREPRRTSTAQPA